MTTDVEQLLITRLDRIEGKVDALAEQVAESRGGRKALVAITSAVGGVIGAAIASMWNRHP